MVKKSQASPRGRVDAIELLAQFLRQMHHEGRVAYIDESANRVFRRVDGQFVEVTSSNAHLSPEASVWIPITAN